MGVEVNNQSIQNQPQFTFSNEENVNEKKEEEKQEAESREEEKR